MPVRKGDPAALAIWVANDVERECSLDRDDHRGFFLLRDLPGSLELVNQVLQERLKCPVASLRIARQ